MLRSSGIHGDDKVRSVNAMDYKDVLAFLAVARLESYSRAAEELHLAQSALSWRVMRLEHAQGVNLFERQPRGVRPTKAGEILVQRARNCARSSRTSVT
jgi:LysR family nitrogen assimilation transcriptional regulator